MDGKSSLALFQIFFGLIFLADYFFKGFFTIKVLRISPHRVNRVLVLWSGIILIVIGTRTFFPGIFSL